MDKFKELFGKASEFMQDHKNIVVPVAFGVVGALVGGAIALVVIRNEGFILDEVDRMGEAALNIDGTLVEDTEDIEE